MLELFTVPPRTPLNISSSPFSSMGFGHRNFLKPFVGFLRQMVGKILNFTTGSDHNSLNAALSSYGWIIQG